MLEILGFLFNDLYVILFQQIVKMSKSRLAYILLSMLFLLGACMEVEKPVTLGVSLIDKKITMTSSSVEELNVEVYLTTEEEAAGELLAKAMNASNQEIGRAKQAGFSLGKDDAKLITFTFDASVDMDLVTKIVIDFRKE